MRAWAFKAPACQAMKVPMPKRRRPETAAERAVETRGGPPAVVIAPRFADVWRANPESLKRGTWVFEWRRARPDLSDDILIVQDVPGAAWIFREKFPDRNLFRMTLAAEPPYWSLEPAKP